LGVRDLKWCVEGGEPQRDDEVIGTNPLPCLRADGDLIAHTLLLDAVRRCDEQNLRGLFTDGGFEDALPIITAPQAKQVGENLVAECRKLCAQPERERVVFRIGVTDE
jgi:hypothetical protein